AATIEVRWDVTARGGAARFRFVAESLFCLLAGNAPDRYLSWTEREVERRDILASRGETPGDASIAVADEWLGLRASVTGFGSAAPLSVWRDAIETVSQSEGGYERVYQGTVVAPVWDAVLAPGESATFVLRVELKE